MKTRACSRRDADVSDISGAGSDTLFVLNDVLGFERYNNLPGFADASGRHA
jgi:hypothetical protein